MAIYLVRLRPEDEPAPEQANLEEDDPVSEAASIYFIGIFVAPSLRELFWQVDEQLDPCRCEYVLLHQGEGFFFTADNSNDADLHYCQRLLGRELDGNLIWRRIPRSL